MAATEPVLRPPVRAEESTGLQAAWYRFGPVLTVLAVLLLVWHAAAVWLNAPQVIERTLSSQPGWGALDRKLGRASKLALMAAPLLLALSWVLLAAWATLGAHALGAESRLAEGAGSPSRLAIIANAWALLKANPWTGLGWGEFNLAPFVIETAWIVISIYGIYRAATHKPVVPLPYISEAGPRSTSMRS